MNFYLLQLIGKWIGFITLSLATSMGFNVSETTTEVENQNLSKNINIQAEVVEYKTIKNYDSSIPSNVSKIINKGQEGVVFTDSSSEVVYAGEAVNEEVTQGTGAYGIYKGITTGYGPDCATCSGRGYVSCKTVDKKAYNLIDDGIYYKDSEYGEARVLAAALSVFPCGTIVEVTSSKMGTFIGIVMDTGYSMKKGLEQGIYHFDIAYKTEKDETISQATDKSGNVVFSVQRWGW